MKRVKNFKVKLAFNILMGLSLTLIICSIFAPSIPVAGINIAPLGILAAILGTGFIPVGIVPGFCIVVQNPLIGASKKTLANNIFYRSYGKNIVRSKPIEYRDKYKLSGTPQRRKFKTVIDFCHNLLGVIRWGLSGYATDMSAYSYCVKKNLNESITGTDPNFSIDLTKVILADGVIPPPTYTKDLNTTPGSAILAWQDDTGQPYVAADDTFNVVIIDQTQQKFASVLNAAARSDTTVTVVLPAWWSATTGTILCFWHSGPNQNKSGAELASKVK